MWIKRFFDNTNDAIEQEDKLILTRRSFFFLSAAAAGAAIVAPTIMKPLTATVSEYSAAPLTAADFRRAISMLQRSHIEREWSVLWPT